MRITVLRNCCAAQVLNGTSIDHKRSSVVNRIRDILAAVAGIGIADLAAANLVLDGQDAVVQDHLIACGLRLRLANRLAIQIKRKVLVCRPGFLLAVVVFFVRGFSGSRRDAPDGALLCVHFFSRLFVHLLPGNEFVHVRRPPFFA